MKLRILQDGNGRYIIEKKKSFFEKWKFIETQGSLQSAKNTLKEIIEDEIILKNRRIKAKQLTLIEQYNLKDI